MIQDLVRGQVGWDAEATVGDFILLRSTGVPVYNFCVAGEKQFAEFPTVNDCYRKQVQNRMIVLVKVPVVSGDTVLRCVFLMCL